MSIYAVLSAVKNLTPTISITKVETILNNGENYAYIAGNQAKITFTTSCLDHVAIQKQSGFIILRRQVL